MALSLALLALSSATAVAAQGATVSLFMPFADPQALEASVVDVDSTATTYVVNCAAGADPEDCGFNTRQTVVQGPETISYVYSFTDSTAGGFYSQDLACNMEPKKDVITCTISVQQEDETGSGMTTATIVSTTGYSSILLPVTVTAGAEKLTATPGATASSGSGSTSFSAPSNGTSTGTRSGSPSVTETASGAATGSGTASTSAVAPATTNAAGVLAPENLLFAGLAAIAGAILF